MSDGAGLTDAEVALLLVGVGTAAWLASEGAPGAEAQLASIAMPLLVDRGLITRTGEIGELEVAVTPAGAELVDRVSKEVMERALG